MSKSIGSIDLAAVLLVSKCLAAVSLMTAVVMFLTCSVILAVLQTRSDATSNHSRTVFSVAVDDKYGEMGEVRMVTSMFMSMLGSAAAIDWSVNAWSQTPRVEVN